MTSLNGDGQGSSPSRPKIELPTKALTILDDVLAHRGWERREGQVKMVETIGDALDVGSFREAFDDSVGEAVNVDVAVNAPVGTGKTLGYLLAGLSRGERVVIATSSKALQDQIVGEELPKLAEDLRAIYGYELTYGVLKGKSTYPCRRTAILMRDGKVPEGEDDLFSDVTVEEPDRRDVETIKAIIDRADAALESRDSLSYDAEHLMSRLTRETAKSLRASKRCAGKTEPWMLAPESADVDPDAPVGFSSLHTPGQPEDLRNVVEHVASNSGCVYRAAYAHCMAAQVVVLNTTLLVYEMKRAFSKWSEETPTLLNGVGVVVVDEAHHLARILAEAYSSETDFRAFIPLVEDTVGKITKRYPDAIGPFVELTDTVRKISDAIVKVDEEADTEDDFRNGLAKQLLRLDSTMKTEMAFLTSRLVEAERANPSAGKKARNGLPRTVAALLETLALEVSGPAGVAAVEITRKNRADEYVNNISTVGDDGEPISIRIVPVDVSFFRPDLARSTKDENFYLARTTPDRSVAILSSGTISAETPRVVGMEPDAFVDVPSPFDPKLARLYVPDVPEPSNPSWFDESWKEVKDAITTVGGRTLILTTSRRRLLDFTAIARAELPFQVLSQEDGTGEGRLRKGELIDLFKKNETSVLVGTMSFWEGVDVPGQALSLVVIDKLPFPSPDDPIFGARREWVKKHDGNPFIQVDVDYAAVMLAQGLGRLIRSVKDVGGAIVLDPRIVTKRYAGAAVRLLPAEWMLTRDRRAFTSWLRWVNPETRKGSLPTADPEVHAPIRAPRPPRRRLR